MALNLTVRSSARSLTSASPNAAPSASRKSIQSRLRAVLETLEGRLTPSGTLVGSVIGGTASTAVSGTVYDDLDKNGVKTAGENGIKGWTVYLDLDNSGTLNTDAAGVLEPSAITNIDGIYTINRLQPGVYRVANVVQPGWEATSPVSKDVTVLLNKSTTADFFNFSGGGIAGTVWNDLSQDGVRATDPTTGSFTEPGLAGWTIFLDVNNNGVPDASEPTTVTDADGKYAFSNLPSQDYEVTEVLPTGWEVSPTFDIKQTASVTARKVVSQDFANFSLTDGSIKGTIWNDTNGNGVRGIDPTTGAFTEPGLSDWTVFVDTNNNGSLDTGELSTVSNADGNYSFISLPAGDYEVTELLPAGWSVSPTFDSRQTVAVNAGEVSTAGDFANFTVLNGSIRGSVWNDLNRNGTRDTTLAGAYSDPGLAGWEVFIDLNRNGVADATEPTALTDAAGGYNFTDLQVGDYEVREILPTGWEPSVGFADSFGVTVFSGSESVAPDFANFNITTATPGSVSGTVWNDINGNGVRESTDPGLAGWTVFIDSNGNRILDATEPKAVSGSTGAYTIAGVQPGSVTVVEQATSGWHATAPISSIHTLALKNAEAAVGQDFGNQALSDSSISGTVFADTNKDGARSAGEKGLSGITVYLDLNNTSTQDAGEPVTTTSADQYFTPTVDEAGTYSFTHLAGGTYTVREVVPVTLSATPAAQLSQTIALSGAENRTGVDSAAQYRPNEIHGIKFDDTNGDHIREAGEPAVAGVTIFVDTNRNDILNAGEPTTITQADGSYTFTNLTPGAYVVREVVPAGYQHTFPTTTGGILWPTGTSNPAVGNVSPTSITTSLSIGQTSRQTVSITLPNTGALTNMVDVFLLFDDTGSFVNNSPIVRAAFPTIISQLQSALPGIDLGFGVGRFEEYANFASEYSTGRPFILNQPIVAASSAGYMTAIQAALNRTTPGYGGDQPETDIEALYQLVTGKGFDGNNNGSVLDSGAAGLSSTQLNPGASGDVPSFASFTADPANSVLPAAGSIGGGGFRSGALPIVLVATDTGFAFQPMGDTSITGVGGSSLPISAFTQTSRPSTPFNSGAGIQQTITGLNALGALVIGLGTNSQQTLDPRQGLEAISKLTGAVNRSTTSIANGTPSPIAPGDPLYFQIASGFGASVANGVTTAIQNAVTNVAVDVTVQASDPRVHITNYTGVRTGVGSGQTATFDVEFTGDGVPHRFDLQFVRNGTNVVLGSIPVVLGTPIPGDCYEFEDLPEGEIHSNVDFGSHLAITITATPNIAVVGGSFTFDGTAHAATAAATGTGGAAVAGSFTLTYNGTTAAPTSAGVYTVVATFTSSDAAYANATGTTTLTISAANPTVSVLGGIFSNDGLPHAASATATGVGGTAVGGSFAFTYNGSSAVPTTAGVYNIVATFTSSDVNYTNATGAGSLTIGTAAPTINVAGGSFTYDGTTHAATATAIGLGGTAVGGVFSYTYNGLATLPSSVGVYTVLATFTSSDSNYADATSSGTLTITAATPTVTVTGGAFIFDGTSRSATALAAGLGGAPVAGAFSFTYNGVATLPKSAGTYAVAANFTSANPNYADASGTGTLTIGTATPTVTVIGGSFLYDAASHSATATATGVGGVTISGTYTFTYNGSAVLPTNAGTYTVAATFAPTDANYSNGSAAGLVIIKKVTPSFANLAAPTINVGTATVAISGRLSAGSLVPVGDVVSVTLNGVTQPATIDASGNFSASFVAGALPAGVYPATFGYFGNATNFNAAATAGTLLTVNAVTAGSISAAGMNVNAIAGAPLTRPVATIVNELGGSASYSAVISWGDGTSSPGQITGSGATLTVTGTHTYAGPRSAVIRVTVRDSLGLGLAATTSGTATITNLGLSAGSSAEAQYWNTSAGQALIRSFGGTSANTGLANWLATNFSNLYGSDAGASNLTGKTNADIALYFQKLWKLSGDGAQSQVLTTALNVYATTASLGGNQGSLAGFQVSVTGLGARSFNVGTKGAAVGAGNNSKLNIFEMLRGVDSQAKAGDLYAGNRPLQSTAKSLFDAVNTI